MEQNNSDIHVSQLILYCSRPGAGQFPVPLGQRFIVGIYASEFTGGRSFTVHSVRGVLISFRVF